MKYIYFALAMICFIAQSDAQRVWTKTGEIIFFSEAPLENIEAINNDVSSVIDIKTGEIVFGLSIRNFEFDKSLMKEHFNEKYLESDKFPQSKFEGEIESVEKLKNLSNGTVDLKVSGKLTIHGVTKPISTTLQFTSKDNIKYSAIGNFNILLADFDIKIPKMVFKNIAEEVLVTLKMNYEPFM